MNKYRKKLLVVEAYQWWKNGDHPNDYDNPSADETASPAYRKTMNWEGDVVRYFRHPDICADFICKECWHHIQSHGWIDMKEDGHRVCPGDWIITGVAGERYPCKPEIFAETYEPV